MFDKLGAAKQKAEEVKAKLDGISVVGESGGGFVQVVSNGNSVIQQVQIHESLLDLTRKEELEELLVVAVNRALESAKDVSESEMRAMMSNMLPGLGGLFGK